MILWFQSASEERSDHHEHHHGTGPVGTPHADPNSFTQQHRRGCRGVLMLGMAWATIPLLMAVNQAMVSGVPWFSQMFSRSLTLWTLNIRERLQSFRIDMCTVGHLFCC